MRRASRWSTMPRVGSVPRSAPTEKLIGRKGSWEAIIPACSGDSGHTDDVVANIIYGSGDTRRRRTPTVRRRQRRRARRRTRGVAVGQRHHLRRQRCQGDRRRSRPGTPRRRPPSARSRPRSPCSASQTDLADLGDITSGTCDVVVAAQTLARRRRPQPAAPPGPPHPQAEHAVRHLDCRTRTPACRPTMPYGDGAATVGEWFVALGRSNFRVDHLVELGASRVSPSPTTLDPAGPQGRLLKLVSARCLAPARRLTGAVPSARSDSVMPAGRGRPNR